MLVVLVRVVVALVVIAQITPPLGLYRLQNNQAVVHLQSLLLQQLLVLLTQ